MCVTDSFIRLLLINEIPEKTGATINLTKTKQKTIINLLRKKGSATSNNSGEEDAMRNDQRYY